MDKINPSSYITDYDPVDEAVMIASNWYETQSTTLEDGSQLSWLLNQGWVIVDVDTTIDSDTGYASVFRWYLSRRVLKPEYALQDLVTSLTNNYNAGRILNDTRYDDIVAIYTAMLDKAEDELNSLESDDTTYDGLIETLISNLSTDFTTHNTDVVSDLDSFGAAERDRVDTQYDALVAKAKQDAIDRGFYNTTMWTATEAGIERERAVADLHVEDAISEKQVKHKDRLYTLRTDMRKNILAARDRLVQSLHDRDTQRVGLRNEVLKAMMNFMERREDDYPDVSNIANLTSSMGSSGGSALPAP